ncbi:MAG TPA: alpha/beta fold hydrolase [Solirubrobacteraceae bacterium]|jgi:pimeloyl-ACP methyl ester carboxylesterase|nr:alpha/beta fold hydrolase [Solirubrobacteraceae bacterium]
MIHHHREGSGPPLVLLHGLGLSWQIWRPLIGVLARDFDVIACDSPGFGESPPLQAGVEPTIPAYAERFAAFFAELGLERPHLAGNSMGGAIGLELARRGAVRSVCAISPAGFWTPTERAFCQLSLGSLASVPRALRPALLALAGTRAGRTALFWQTFGRPALMPPDEPARILLNAWASPALAPALDAFSAYAFDSAEQLDASAPVTVGWGVHDRLLPYRTQAPRARALLPRTRHVALGAGHVPVFDDPAAVCQLIRSAAA